MYWVGDIIILTHIVDVLSYHFSTFDIIFLCLEGSTMQCSTLAICLIAETMMEAGNLVISTLLK